jgi:large repetitive protein
MRTSRRLSLLVILVFAFVTAVPSQALPQQHTGFPLGWLWELLSARPTWAAGAGPAPKQAGAAATDVGHYVTDDSTRSKNGTGRKPTRAPGELDPYTPHSADRTVVTGPQQGGFDEKTKVRVPEASSAMSTMWRDADGTYAREIYQEPVNYRAADGTWQPIDGTLTRVEGGRWESTANSWKLSVAGGAAASDGGAEQTTSGRLRFADATTEDLVTVSVPSGGVIGYSLEGATIGAPIVTDGSVVYTDALPYTDVRIDSLPQAAKETLILHSASAATSWTYRLNLAGVTPSLDADGNVVFTNDSGSVVAWMPRGFMKDSSFNPQSGDAAYSHNFSYELIMVDGEPAVRATADAAWLADPARVFPVYVDPELRLDNSDDTYVQYGDDINHSGEDNLAVGTWDSGTHRARALMHFSSFATTYAGKRLSYVTVNLFLTWQYNCTNQSFTVHPINTAWSETSARWGSSTTYGGPAMGSSLGSASPNSSAACGNTNADRSVGSWVPVVLDVPLFNDWATGGTNNGLALMSSDTNNAQFKRFTSRNGPTTCGTRSCAPYIYAIYTDEVAPQIDARYPANNGMVSSLTPELLTTAHDPDNWPNKGLKYFYQVYSDTGAALFNSGWVSTPAWTIPTGKLAWGKTYLYAVQVDDSSKKSAISPAYAFSVPVPQPVITSGLSPNGTKGYDASVGNYTTTATDATVAAVGPPLTITREYNSLSMRSRNAFGAGWSSVADMRATQSYDASGAVETVVVTYPNGQEAAFGRNGTTYTPPAGRFATFTQTTDTGGNVNGYVLTDKDGTVYTFAQLATGEWPTIYRISSITDANGRKQTFTYDATSGYLTTITGAAGTGATGRALHLEWTVPNGSNYPHVIKVTTDPATAGDATSALTWTYDYTGMQDRLVKVCPPTTNGGCARYTYQWLSQHGNVVLNNGPYSYWRLGEASGAVAASSVLANAGTDNGTYSNVTLGGTDRPWSQGPTAAQFSGSNSYVQLPGKLVAAGAYQSISMWFRTTTAGGVLFSYSANPITNGTTASNYTPALYIDSNGYLRGEFWQGAATPMKSNAPVTDDTWHHVVLSGAGSTQALYLDGAKQGSSLSGTIAPVPGGSAYEYIGAGFIGNGWPDHTNTGASPAVATYFTGKISEVAFFNKAISSSAANTLFLSGRWASTVLTQITRPTGKTTAQVAYDTVTGRVTSVTDENGGTWAVSAPTTGGSSEVYAASVLGGKPVDYWRLTDLGPTDAVNEVAGNTASYSTVTLGATGSGAFADTTAAQFDGTTSYVALPAADIPATGPTSVGLWFKTATAGSTSGGVLFGYQSGSITDVAGTAGWVPAIYVDTSGYLRGGFYISGGPAVTSTKKVNDGAWHQVVLAGAGSSQSLYLDGALVGTKSATILTFAATNSYIGAGKWQNWAGTSGATGYFAGSIAEVAYYNTQLSAAQAKAQYDAAKQSLPVAITMTDSGVQPVPMPVQTTSVTVPGGSGKTISSTYDLVNGNRVVAETDALGNTKRYGYDVAGFDSVVYDESGARTETGKDVRGNTIRTTTCQRQVTNQCNTVYYTYWPDATSTTLTPDPRNDQMTSMRDGRSSSATDTTYAMTIGYDTSGNRTIVTTPPVTGYATGRTTRTEYTTATMAANGGGVTPAGLPYKTTTPGNAVQTTEYNAVGDVVKVTDAVGLITEFTYDGLGRPLSKITEPDTDPTTWRTTEFVYGTDGQLRQTKDVAVTNHVTSASPHQALTALTYDDDGNVLTQTVSDLTGGDVARTTTSVYDEHGRTHTQTDPAGAVTTYEYDVFGNTTATVDHYGNRVENIYDEENHLLTTTAKAVKDDPDSTATRDVVLTQNAWDPEGHLAWTKDAKGWTTFSTYYDDGRLDQTIRCTIVNVADGADDDTTVDLDDCPTGNRYILSSNTYDAAGNLTTTKTNNDTTVTTNTYDAANRVTSTQVDPSGVKRTTTSTYDADDHALNVTVTENTGAVASSVDRTYDALGRTTSETINNDVADVTGWWKLNETSGTVTADSSASGLNGTATNVTWNGDSAAFNGTSSQILTAGPAVSTTGSFTVSAWAKLDAIPTDWKTVVSQDGNNVPGFEIHYERNSGKWAFTRHNTDNAAGSDPVRAYSYAAPTLGAWTHLVGVYDASTKSISLYVDTDKAALTGSATVTTALASTGSVRIGSTRMSTNVSNYFPGSIDNVQIYPRALGPAEIETLYNSSGYGRTGKALQTAKLTTSYTLDKRGLVTKSTDPSGNETTYTYDEAGRLAETHEPQVTVETYGATPATTSPTTIVGYNTFGEQVDQQDPTGKWTHTTVNATGLPTSVKVMTPYTAPGTSTPMTSETTTEYDLLGQATTTTDPLGKITTYKYDSLGRTVKVIDPLLRVSQTAYDDLGNVTQTIDPSGATSGTTYDFLSRPKTDWQDVTKPAYARYTATTDYGTNDLSPWPMSSTTHQGVTTTYTYNNVGELTKTTDENGNHTDYTYDGLGRRTVTTLPDLSSQVTTYNLAGQITTVATRNPSGGQVTSRSMTYDRTGNMLTATDARKTTTHLTYDAAGNIVSETQKVSIAAGEAITTSFGYDANGARTRFTDGRGNPFWTTYNSWGLLEKKIEPTTTAYPNEADRTYTTAYDQAGRVANQLSPGNVSVTNTYDDLGNLKRQTGAGAETATVDRVFDYDPASRIKSFTTGTDTTNLDYDERGLLLSAVGPNTNSSFRYDGDGRMTQRTDAAGTTTYGYNNIGLLGSITNTTAQVSQTYDYNSLNQVSQIVYGAARKRTLTYDPMHLLATDTLSDTANTTTYGSISYGYDENGNEIRKTTSGFGTTAGTITNNYTYDLADRLTSWSDGTTTVMNYYDNAGNRTRAGSQYFRYDERNRLIDQIGAASYEYTARGTLALTRNSTTGDQTTVADAFDQIQSQGSTTGPKTYSYDAFGRVQRAGFAYTGLDNDLAGDGTNTYVRGPDSNLISEQTGGTKVYAWTDQHSDVVGQFTDASTTLTGSRIYDPLGKVVNNAGLIGALGYQSEWTDTDTGRVNMLARWYNTDTGQFDTRDNYDGNPIPASVDANRYAYVNDNPLTRTDPTGHCWLCGNPFKKAASFLSNTATSYYHAATAAVSWVGSKISSAYNYARSGRMWDDIKSGARYAYDKAKKVGAAVVHSTVKWVKKKAHAVSDAYHKAKNCLSQGAAKCVKHAVKSAAKSVYETAKATAKAIKKDPWKFIATAAVGLAATVAVGALCATGVGCLILAGAVAGAMSAGAGYMVDVARGDQQFSVSGLVGTMVEGGLDGALSAGVSKFTGGIGNKLGTPKLSGMFGKPTNRLNITGSGGGPRRAANGRYEPDPGKAKPGDLDDDGMITGTNKPGYVTSRPKLRISKAKQVWADAEPGPNGGRMCRRQGPNCVGEVMVPPGTGKDRDWDYGHDQGDAWSNTKFPADVKRDEVLDRYHESGGLECGPCNRGAGAD